MRKRKIYIQFLIAGAYIDSSKEILKEISSVETDEENSDCEFEDEDNVIEE